VCERVIEGERKCESVKDLSFVFSVTFISTHTTGPLGLTLKKRISQALP